MKSSSVLLVAFLLALTTGTSQQSAEEVMAPAAAWNDAEPWGGEPPWTWYEDPASVDCAAAKTWCQKAGLDANRTEAKGA